MEMCRHRLAHMPAQIFPGRDSKMGDSAECDIETDSVCYRGRHLHRHRLRHMEIERGVAEA